MSVERIAITSFLAAALLATAAPRASAAAAGDALAAARGSMLGTVAPTQPGVFEEQPNADGDYVYEATAAKPLVKGGRCDLEADRIVKGLTIARTGEANGALLPDNTTNAGLYWTLKGIRKGSYWIGILCEGNGSVIRVGVPTFYLNGRIVQLATAANPVQLAPGVWFSEALAAAAVELEPGDEIAVAFNRPGAAARLILHDKAPAPVFESPWRLPKNFGGNQWNPYTALGVSAEGRFMLNDGSPAANLPVSAIEQTASSVAALRDAAGKVQFVATLSNPLGVPVTVDYSCAVKTFYAETVGRDAQRLTLQPHERVERRIAFDWKDDERTHFADIVLLGVEPPDLSRTRQAGGLGWPKYEVLSFFPGHRQILKWPDPFNTRVVRRVTIEEPAGGSRQAHGLDGNDWEMGYTTELEPPMPAPAAIKFERVRVPKGWHWPNLNDITPRPHGAYFRRAFNLPDALAGRSFKLIVEYAYDEATAYVNGQKCGNVRGDIAPIVCDITKALKPGTNEIVIVVRDLIAIMNPAYVTPGMTIGNIAYLDAPGLHGKDGVGLGSVHLESAPLVSSEDAFVATSVRKKDITARITVANRGTAEARVKATAEVLDDGKPVLALGDRELTLKPDQPVEFSLAKAWAKPVLWGPGSPHLYALRVTLADAATGKVLDVRRDRFGFRESWIDGPNIMFNGIAIKPVGYSPMIRFNPKGNFLFTRGGGRDWLDEVGLLGYRSISGVYNTPSQHNVESEKFWQAAESNNLASLRLMQNSPHILAWDLSNEWLCHLEYSVNDTMQGARRFKHLSDTVRAYDPTRWTLGNAEGDFKGLLDNHSFHYMRPYFESFGAGMRGHSEYLPDSAFWRPLDQHFTPGQDIVVSPFLKTVIRPDLKVVMDTEFLWKVGALMPPGPSAIVGEDDVLSAAVDSWSGPMAWKWKTDIDGHRDLGLSLVNIYSFHPGVVRGAFLEQTFIVPENQRHGYAGTRQTRHYTLLNGLFHPSELTFRWSLSDASGKVVAKGQDARTLVSGDIQRGKFAFDLPQVKQPAVFTLKAVLESGGEFVCGEEWDLDVFPAEMPPLGGLSRSLVLFDPSGKTAATLKRLGVAFTTLDACAAPAGDPAATLLIIGEDALDEKTAVQGAGLVPFVEQGGKVLVLGQTWAPSHLPVATKLAPKVWNSQAFVRSGSHPLMQGLDSLDLHFWQPDRAVGVGAYTRPDEGNVAVLVDSGNGETGLEWVHLMEAFRGKGSYLLCQMPLVSRFDVEPMARELLRRAVAYLGGDAPWRCPVDTVRVLAAADSALVAKLKGAKVAHAVIADAGGADTASACLLDAASVRLLDAGTRAGFAAALRGGATVAVLNVTPEDQDWLTELAGAPVAITVPPYLLWDGRAFRKGWSDYTAGLSHIDLYWKRYVSTEQSGGQSEEPELAIEPLQDFAVSGPALKELVFPGALVQAQVGRGTLLVDQRRWTSPNDALRKLTARNLASLMTALNVNIEPYIQPKELPAEVDHKPVDLRPYANRAFLDEVAEDGKGGWVDQGPRADLRTFPTGKQSFKGVPFAIGEAPACCIVLASDARPGSDTMPKSVEIPVGFPAEGLYFLHGSAYTGGPSFAMGNYRIYYADGTFVDIPLKGMENISDWACPSPLNNERGTTSVVAWTGKNEVFALIGVFRMLWVNEKPDVPIKSVVFSKPDPRSVPVLIGLTAAVKKGQFPTLPEQAAKARQRFAAGQAAFAKEQLDAARSAFREVIDLDPTLKDAYQAFATVAEKQGDDAWILEAYGAWIYSGPRSPMPYNRVAETLEKRKDINGALANYRESLKVEWNQPPVIEAVKRLELSL